MNSQKRDNSLNLALDSTELERAKSIELDVGFSPIEDVWELILKYAGDINALTPFCLSITPLSGNFAIVRVRRAQIDALTNLSEVIFIEKPKRLFFQSNQAQSISCIPPLRAPSRNLTGKGILIAIIDSGIRYQLPAFQNPGGTTRIRYLWDQNANGTPPAGYTIGAEYSANDLNSLSTPTFDPTGHGTAVAGIAAASPESIANITYQGVAPGSDLLIVKLAPSERDGFSRTTYVMQAVDYVIKKAQHLSLPVVVNLSFGNTYGAHDGSTLLEQFLDSVATTWKSCICVGCGNEAAASGHISGEISPNEDTVIELAISPMQEALNLQIWKSYTDSFEIYLRTPANTLLGPLPRTGMAKRYTVGNTQLLIYYGMPDPFRIAQEIYIEFLPTNDYVTSGIWEIIFSPVHIVTGRYALWLPSSAILSTGTGFLTPTPYGTATIPSTARGVIAVGAYQDNTLAYADFSGRGSRGLGTTLRPDLVAPGVDISAPTPEGTYRAFTGTSFATPLVTGTCALLMEWGITNGNDPYLYGEKMRAYLRRGALPLPAFESYPNELVGWGRLCADASLPETPLSGTSLRDGISLL